MGTMDRRSFIQKMGQGALGIGVASSLPGFLPRSASAGQGSRPNIVIIFTDDQGYADVGCYGARGFDTPNLDHMADDGVRFTDFHVSTAVCSASRASLLTGCYPERVSILGALFPDSQIGINEGETLLPEILKPLGYATAVYGKWHLGDHRRFLPTRHGFDDYFGLPFSNDMWPGHPELADDFQPLPLIEGEDIVQYNPDQRMLTTWYTERAVKFIRDNSAGPFFLYLAHSMPHVPLFVSDKFAGASENGMYGDVIMEIDWSVGQVLQALREEGIDDNTIVIFTSDNGPWLSYGDHAGSTGPLREGKATMFEGGVRVPCIMRWPGKIPAGTTCPELTTTMDLLPTLTGLVGGALPNRKIDGHDISGLIFGEDGAAGPYDVLYYYFTGELRAVRAGKWKLHLPHKYRTLDGGPGGTGGLPSIYSQAEIGLELYDLEADLGETTDIAAANPEVVRRLSNLAEEARAELGDRLTGRVGAGVRPPGRL